MNRRKMLAVVSVVSMSALAGKSAEPPSNGPSNKSQKEIKNQSRHRPIGVELAFCKSPVILALAIGSAFTHMVRTSHYTICACSILPEHTHLVLARHKYSVELIVKLLKGAATVRNMEEGRHSLIEHALKESRPPRMWAARGWKVHLDSEEASEDEIR